MSEEQDYLILNCEQWEVGGSSLTGTIKLSATISAGSPSYELAEKVGNKLNGLKVYAGETLVTQIIDIHKEEKAKAEARVKELENEISILRIKNTKLTRQLDHFMRLEDELSQLAGLKIERLLP